MPTVSHDATDWDAVSRLDCSVLWWSTARDLDYCNGPFFRVDSSPVVGPYLVDRCYHGSIVHDSST